MDIRKYPIKGDARGSLIALECGDDIPFDVKRVYYIFKTGKNVVRGCHAHRKLEQILICVSGSCSIMLDDGKSRETVELADPAVGLYVGPGVWREMSDFSSDAVLLVLASSHYDKSDYIYNYQEFIYELVEKRG